MGGPDELGAAPELRARAGRRDLRQRFTAPDEHSGKGVEAGAGFGGHGLAGEHGLIDKDGSCDQSHIGRNDGAERQLDQVAFHQVRGRQRLPDAVASHRCRHRQARLQGVERRLGASLLEKPKARVENQEKRDGRCFHIFAEHQLQHDRRLEHPRNRRPEFFQSPVDRMRRHVLNDVFPADGQPATSFVARQSGRGFGALYTHRFLL